MHTILLTESKISCTLIKKTEGHFRYQICKRRAKYTLTNFQIFWYINQITTSFGGIDLQMILKNVVKKATKDLKSLDVIAKPIKHINV